MNAIRNAASVIRYGSLTKFSAFFIPRVETCAYFPTLATDAHDQATDSRISNIATQKIDHAVPFSVNEEAYCLCY